MLGHQSPSCFPVEPLSVHERASYILELGQFGAITGCHLAFTVLRDCVEVRVAGIPAAIWDSFLKTLSLTVQPQVEASDHLALSVRAGLSSGFSKVECLYTDADITQSLLVADSTATLTGGPKVAGQEPNTLFLRFTRTKRRSWLKHLFAGGSDHSTICSSMIGAPLSLSMDARPLDLTRPVEKFRGLTVFVAARKGIVTMPAATTVEKDGFAIEKGFRSINVTNGSLPYCPPMYLYLDENCAPLATPPGPFYARAILKFHRVLCDKGEVTLYRRGIKVGLHKIEMPLKGARALLCSEHLEVSYPDALYRRKEGFREDEEFLIEVASRVPKLLHKLIDLASKTIKEGGVRNGNDECVKGAASMVKQWRW